MNIHIIKRQYSEIISVREKKGSIMKEFFSMGKTMKKLISVVMSLALLLTSAGVIFSGSDVKGAAAEVVSSMDYYSTNDGPTITHSGVGTVSYGFVMPKFNGKASSELSIADVEKDIQVYVKQENGTNGEWKKIEDVSYFKWNDTWAWEYQSWGGWVCWMKLTETTYFRFHGKTNNINLDYKLELNKLSKYKLTSISTTETNIQADTTGGSATHWGAWTFNGDKSIKYEQIQDDVNITVDNNDGKGFVQFLGNAASGFLWDQNFGYYSDGDGGYWFTNISWSFTLRFASKSNPNVHQDVKVTYTKPTRSNYKITAYNGTSYDASTSDTASVGIPLPKIGGTEAIKDDLDLFKYEVKVDGKWIPLTDVAACGWVYEGSGYNKYSLSSQWGYFVDHVYGLWLQPVRQDTEIKVTYPIDGKKGGDASNNYVLYTIKGNTSYKPTLPSDMSDIKVNDNSNAYTPAGWKMIFNDEFDGASLDTSKWSYDEGFLLKEDDINTAGWGNQELEYYTRDNVSVKDGALNILMKKQSKVFTEKGDPSKKATAQYSSGKITTKDKFSVKYGRVDFRAKMPTGTGIWPAMWMLPNDSLYGSWPLSGEIDVFEGRGRTPNMVFGTLHYGAQWPNNINTSDAFNITRDGNKKTGIDDWHVYSVQWDAENIKIYCDGKCYFKCTYGEWYSGSDRGNAYAPFDQRFYLILNLAAGGTFDSGYVPDSSFTSGTMLVDYVRVYQRMVKAGEDEKADKNAGVSTNGAKDGLYGDYKIGKGVTPITPGTTNPSETKPEGTTNPSETKPEGTTASSTTKKIQKKTPNKALKTTVVKKATKKKNAKKIRLSFRKVKGAKRYQVQVSKNKKFTSVIVTKTVKKYKKVTISKKAFEKRKELFVRVRAVGCKKWSKPKKVRILKK